MREDWIKISFEEAVSKVSTSKQKIKQKAYLTKGNYPVVDQGIELIGGYSDDFDRVLKCKLPVIVFGDHTKALKLVDFKFVPGADGTKVLEPKAFVNPKFLYYISKTIVYYINDNGYARHYQHLEKKFLPIAPLPEQRAIVAKIEALFSDLDKAEADLRKAQEQLKVYRQAVLKKAFEHIEEKTALGNCGEWKGGGTPSRSVKEYWGGDIPWVSSRDVKTKEIHDTERHITEIAIPNSSTKWVEKESLLFVMRSGILRRIFPIAIAKTRLCVNQDIQTVSLNEKWNPEFLYWYLLGNESDIRNSCSKDGTTVESIDAVALKSYKVPYCSLNKQNHVVQEIESILSNCEMVEQRITESLVTIRSLRQSILKKAFEGTLLSEAEIETCKKESDWEPASALLERIRKRR